MAVVQEMDIVRSNIQDNVLSNEQVNNSQTSPRILLIEDDSIVQKIHKRFLEQMGYIVDVAASGQQTFELYQPGRYQLIVLDGGLPDTTGFEIAKVIRRQENPNKRQPMILLSAFLYDRVRDACLEASIDDFAIKPVSFDALKTIVQRWLAKI